MFRYRIAMLGVSATLLLTGTAVVRAAEESAAVQMQKLAQAQTQTRDEKQAREQAIKSVKQRLKEDPRDEGLHRAQECLERNEKCQDIQGLEKAMESVRKNMERHPQDAGLRNAMDHLDRNHQRLEKQRMERERPMPRQDSGRPEKPDQSHNK